MWAKILNTIIGLWLMVAPGIFPYSELASHNNRIIGPIVVTFTIISFWEATQAVRKWNYPLAIWLFAAPWILGYESTIAMASDISAGILVFTFSTVKEKVELPYGGGWSSLLKKEPKHWRESGNAKVDNHS